MIVNWLGVLLELIILRVELNEPLFKVKLEQVRLNPFRSIVIGFEPEEIPVIEPVFS